MAKLTKVETRDGSITFRNEDVQETYHTMSGATNEALEKHVVPSSVLESPEPVIADVCFGLGYNTIVALHEYLLLHPDDFVQVFAFENDEEIITKIAELDYGFYQPTANTIKHIFDNQVESNNDYDVYVLEADKFIITLYLGDLQKTLPKIADNVFTTVFFDPFSPKKMPELWSKDIFEQVYRTMQKGATLTTYSCANVARTNMKAVGLKPVDGPSIGRTSPSTIATK